MDCPLTTRVFSPLKFQADIGIMLTFTFLVNMLAAWPIRPRGLPARGASALSLQRR
jgi:hypothetical protein